MSRGLGGPSPVGMVSASPPETPASLACPSSRTCEENLRWPLYFLAGGFNLCRAVCPRFHLQTWDRPLPPGEVGKDPQKMWSTLGIPLRFFLDFIPWFKGLWPKALAVPRSQWPSTTLPVTMLTYTSPASPDFVPEPGHKQNPAEGPQGLAVGVKHLQGLRR